mmetsp:Transcript_4491/g.10952  ORF Transcript_4491/g.10952 Transcript_4491/m.10952 type:complete len:407 (+) Transcript_4491:232-1452(+)
MRVCHYCLKIIASSVLFFRLQESLKPRVVVLHPADGVLQPLFECLLHEPGRLALHASSPSLAEHRPLSERRVGEATSALDARHQHPHHFAPQNWRIGSALYPQRVSANSSSFCSRDSTWGVELRIPPFVLPIVRIVLRRRALTSLLAHYALPCEVKSHAEVALSLARVVLTFLLCVRSGRLLLRAQPRIRCRKGKIVGLVVDHRRTLGCRSVEIEQALLPPRRLQRRCRMPQPHVRVRFAEEARPGTLLRADHLAARQAVVQQRVALRITSALVAPCAQRSVERVEPRCRCLQPRAAALLLVRHHRHATTRHPPLLLLCLRSGGGCTACVLLLAIELPFHLRSPVLSESTGDRRGEYVLSKGVIEVINHATNWHRLERHKKVGHVLKSGHLLQHLLRRHACRLYEI